MQGCGLFGSSAPYRNIEHRRAKSPTPVLSEGARPGVKEAVSKWKAANPVPTSLTGDDLKAALGKRERDAVKVISTTLGLKPL